MRFAHLRSKRRPLQFEQLEDRLALSASVGAIQIFSSSDMSAMKKPVGALHPVGLTPTQVRTAYGFNNISFGGITGDGAGQTIAIVDAKNDPTIANDLHVFNQQFNLPEFNVSGGPSFTVVNSNGGTKLPKNSRGWAAEIALDVEWAHAIAPAANILLVEAKSDTTLGDAIDYARHVPGVTVVSLSVGGKEFKQEAAVDDLFTTPAGHVGETFVYAAGDDGGKAEYPSSSPNVLSVGGTSLDISFSGQWLGETVWSDGGGGLSKYEGVPSYQSGLGLTARGTPDVTYDGDPETGFAVYDTYGTGGWGQYGGTSVGTPQWAALLAIANQGRVLGGKDPLENAQAALYQLPSADFHDIVSGSNGNLAATGYDLASGLGSPIANLLIPDLVAFNGSTDFTVSTLITTKPGKSSKHIDFSGLSLGPAAVQLGHVGVSSSTASLDSAFDSSFDSTVRKAGARVSSINFAVATSSATRPSDSSDNEHVSKARRRSTRRDPKPDAPAVKSDSAFAGIDKFFANLAG